MTHLEPDALDILRSTRKFAGSTRRHVIVRPDRLELLRGPALVASLPFPGRGGASLADVAAALAGTPQAGWAQETAPGVFLLRVSLVQAPGTVLELAAPAVRQVRLLDDPEVYLSAMGATARFTGVTVTSWDPERGRPAANRGQRPFVEYADGSDLRITRSTFAYLGSDRASAYGVNWRRSTGGASGSVFHHNFFGAYSYQAHDLVFRGNVFRDNQVYGLDPHTGSTRLVVEDNQAFRNKAHGIVFSEDVTDGVVRRNRTYANGGNGIVLDERSDRNTVSGNLAEATAATASSSSARRATWSGATSPAATGSGSGSTCAASTTGSSATRCRATASASSSTAAPTVSGCWPTRSAARPRRASCSRPRGRPAATTGSPGRRSGSRSTRAAWSGSAPP